MSHVVAVTQALSGVSAAGYVSAAPVYKIFSGTPLKDALVALSTNGVTGALVYNDDIAMVRPPAF